MLSNHLLRFQDPNPKLDLDLKALLQQGTHPKSRPWMSQKTFMSKLTCKQTSLSKESLRLIKVDERKCENETRVSSLFSLSCFTMKTLKATFATNVVVLGVRLWLENTISSCHQQSYTSLPWHLNTIRIWNRFLVYWIFDNIIVIISIISGNMNRTMLKTKHIRQTFFDDSCIPKIIN